jgi:hypothetical protein
MNRGAADASHTAHSECGGTHPSPIGTSTFFEEAVAATRIRNLLEAGDARLGTVARYDGRERGRRIVDIVDIVEEVAS